jgi:trimeric autotransporter adhesin
MAIKIWRGDAPAVAQVVRITPANVLIGDTFSVTINGKSVTVTATASTAANVVDKLVAAIGATEIAEFSELIATNEANTLLLTAAEPGVPFTVTASAVNGSTMGVSVAVVQEGRAAVAAVPMRQQIAIPKSAAGTFTINVGNAVTSALSIGASAGTVQNAIEGLSTVGSGNATVTASTSADGNDDLYLVTFGGALAGLTVATMIVKLTTTRPIIRTVQEGSTTGTPRNEIQTIDCNGVSGSTFTLTLDGQTTTAMTTGSDLSSAITSALSALSNIDDATITVTKGTGQLYTVEFTYTEGSHAQSQMTASNYSSSGSALYDLTVTAPQAAAAAITALNEQQRVTLTGVPTGGTFTLTFAGQTTSALAFNASASTVQTQLRALSTIGAGNVNVTSDNGYLVEFVGTMAAANQALITGNGASLTGGSAQAVTVSTVTSSSGPNHWDTAANWLPAGVPANGDDVRIEFGESDILYGLDASAVTLASIEFFNRVGTGLPRLNPLGFIEYRTRDLTLKCPVILINSEAGKIQLNTLDAACTLELRNSGGSSESGVPAVTWYGSHASNAIVLINGDLGVAIWSDQAATINTVRQYGGQLRLDHSTVEDLYAAGQQISAHETTLGGQPLEL